MRSGTIILAGALALLAGCGESGQQASRNEPEIKIRNEAHEGLLALSRPSQRLYMMRAIRGTGHRCRRVDNAAYQQEHGNLQMWVGQCVEDRTFAVFIAPGGDVQVRNCIENAQLNLPACRPLPPLPPGELPPPDNGAAEKAD